MISEYFYLNHLLLKMFQIVNQLKMKSLNFHLPRKMIELINYYFD